MFKRLLCGLAAIALLACAAGCRQEAVGDPLENEADGQNLEHSTSSGNEGYRRTVLYYATDDGFVVPVMKMIPWEDRKSCARLFNGYGCEPCFRCTHGLENSDPGRHGTFPAH